MNKKKKSGNAILYVVLLIIIVGFVYIFFVNHDDKYTKMEKRMVEKAKEYVINNNISSEKELFFDVTKLGITLENDCNVTSGVFFENGNYQAYLSCNEYETKILDSSNEFFSLNGKAVYIIAKGVGFYDPGYRNSGDIINTYGEVLKDEGIYNILYVAKNSNSVLKRKVAVVDSPVILSLFPSISLYGGNETYAIYGTEYKDSGAMATDSNDENITNNIKVYGNVNTSKIGDYRLDYVITNKDGYTNATSRIVNVISPDPSLNFSYSLNPNKLTSKDVTINISVDGDDFSHVVLPNNIEDKNSHTSYTVSDNGTYEFILYDNKGRNVKNVVVVDNIDRAKPEASCIATWYYNRTEVAVNIISNKNITNYEYNVANKIETSQNSSYTSPLVKPNNITVKVTDEIDNSKVINCTIIDKSTPQIYVDSNGKRCLEGYKCYVQSDWDDNSYYFCSDIAKKSCGSIAGHGCSITSFSTVVSKFGVKAANGELHTPYTILSEIYNGRKIAKNGYCSSGCSGWSAIKKAALELGLTTQDKYLPFNKSNVEIFKDYLRRGYGVILAVGVGPYSTGNHIIAVLGIREDDYVYLYNTNAGVDTSCFNSSFKQNDWVPIDNLLHGNVKSFFAIGPGNQ